MRMVLRSVCFLLAVLLFRPSTAAADTLFTMFGGLTTFTGGLVHNAGPSVSYGGSVAFKKKFGIEVDFGYSNDYGKTPNLEADNARSFMVNAIVDAGPRHGRIQPYVSGGAGLVSFKVVSMATLFKADSAVNNLGINVGGGAMIATGTALSLRADVRYFKSLDEFGTANIKPGFVRISGGVLFGF
jgi:opacity protein-like surface antigen